MRIENYVDVTIKNPHAEQEAFFGRRGVAGCVFPEKIFKVQAARVGFSFKKNPKNISVETL